MARWARLSGAVATQEEFDDHVSTRSLGLDFGHVARIPNDIVVIEVGNLETASISPGAERLISRTRNTRGWEGWTGEEPILCQFGYVGVSPDAAQWLVDHGILLVDTDALSVGSYGDTNREPHTKLVGNEFLVTDVLDRSRIESGRCNLVYLPLKPVAGDGAPACVRPVRQS